MVIETGLTIAWYDDTPYNNSEIFKLVVTGGGFDGGADGDCDGSADGGTDAESMLILC